jgi:hypothetical protein
MKKKQQTKRAKREPMTISIHGEGIHIDIDMRLDGAQDAAHAFGEVCETIAARFFRASSVHVPQAVPVGPEPFVRMGAPIVGTFDDACRQVAPNLSDCTIDDTIRVLVAERDRRSAIREATAS